MPIDVGDAGGDGGGGGVSPNLSGSASSGADSSSSGSGGGGGSSNSSGGSWKRKGTSNVDPGSDRVGASVEATADASSSASLVASDDSQPRKPSWGSSMFVLQLTGKLKRGNLLRRREKQQRTPKPKAAIGMINELAALSSRDQADEQYVQELQCARHHRLSLVFYDGRFEEKYVAYHHDNWSLSALRERLLKFLGAFVFFAAFEDVLGSMRDDALAAKLVAYAVILAVFFGCCSLNEGLQWLEARPSADVAALTWMRMPLHAGFSVAWSFMLMGMAVHFEEIRYLSALLMPLLYAHSILHFQWLGCIYLLLAVAFELTWVYLLNGWNPELDISTRGHSLHGVLLMAASLFMFVKYVREQDSREHFKLVEMIELRKQQHIRGNTLAQKLIANILPPFIVPQLGVHQSLARPHVRIGASDGVPKSSSFRPSKRAQVIAHSYSSISVLFATVLVESADKSMISKLTSHDDCSESAQLERVLLLDQVFSMFDHLLDSPLLPQRSAASAESQAVSESPPSPLMKRASNVPPTNTASPADACMYEKIKTIGNTYMVAAGIPHGHGPSKSKEQNDIASSSHAQAAVALSCKMQQAVASFNLDPERLSNAPNGTRVRLRVGIHSGAVTAGVIGIEKYCFDIWGDTVNVASRMDATGIPGRIQVSAVTRHLLPGRSVSLDGMNDAEFEARGNVQVKGKGLMETFLVSQMLGRPAAHQTVAPLPLCASPPCALVLAASDEKGPRRCADEEPKSAPLQVPLQPYSLVFKSSAAEIAFRKEYTKTNLSVATASAVLVIMFLLSFVFLTGCWAWVHFLGAAETSDRDSDEGGSGNGVEDYERQMQLAWLVVVGNTLLAATMIVQVQCSALTQHMQRLLGTFSVVSILIIFAMNVAADLIGYSQLLETPYILSGLIYVFFLSKLLVVYAARVCWTWLLAHTVYRYSATGLQSLFYAQFGSPLYLCAMTMMLHVLASDAERKVRQGHWLRILANAQRWEEAAQQQAMCPVPASV